MAKDGHYWRETMNIRSHSKKQILDAQQAGQTVFALDTGDYGEDDVLIGTEAECRADVMNYHDLDSWPEGWELNEVTDFGRIQ